VGRESSRGPGVAGPGGVGRGQHSSRAGRVARAGGSRAGSEGRAVGTHGAGREAVAGSVVASRTPERNKRRALGVRRRVGSGKVPRGVGARREPEWDQVLRYG